MTKITEIQKEEENKIKQSNRIDKQSSARIIKRSLWMHAQKQTAQSKPEQQESNAQNVPNKKHTYINDSSDDEEDNNNESLKRIKIDNPDN